MTAILSKTFFVWLSCTIEFQLESYGPRHTSVDLSYDIVCVYCMSVYTSLFGTQLRLTTKLTNVVSAYMYYTPNGRSTANNELFYKSEVG